MLNQHLVQRPGIGAAGTGLEPTEGGRTGQCLIAPDGRLHQQVRAQRVVIVQVFVAAAQAIQALGDEIAQAVANPPPARRSVSALAARRDKPVRASICRNSISPPSELRSPPWKLACK